MLAVGGGRGGRRKPIMRMWSLGLVVFPGAGDGEDGGCGGEDGEGDEYGGGWG